MDVQRRKSASAVSSGRWKAMTTGTTIAPQVPDQVSLSPVPEDLGRGTNMTIEFRVELVGAIAADEVSEIQLAELAWRGLAAPAGMAV
jgi:hypothetical protein